MPRIIEEHDIALRRRLRRRDAVLTLLAGIAIGIVLSWQAPLTDALAGAIATTEAPPAIAPRQLPSQGDPVPRPAPPVTPDCPRSDGPLALRMACRLHEPPAR
ncbi:hypothetical protein [Algiphilus sp.]|uniref:hypothetical protein n=1 Tax=Algiphilus sp. TaxID=1872431 RepID=UPI0025BE7FF5|nr:hypothetical protein [Algiphilus sp.]MCK5770548.1 hypothetical protein [Algiphilus sp.]